MGRLKSFWAVPSSSRCLSFWASAAVYFVTSSRPSSSSTPAAPGPRWAKSWCISTTSFWNSDTWAEVTKVNSFLTAESERSRTLAFQQSDSQLARIPSTMLASSSGTSYPYMRNVRYRSSSSVYWSSMSMLRAAMSATRLRMNLRSSSVSGCRSSDPPYSTMSSCISTSPVRVMSFISLVMPPIHERAWYSIDSSSGRTEMRIKSTSSSASMARASSTTLE
mmetsp:Transcript_24920/g.78547  ORF Transcript_24920/g.78547 Transcript_24920/m.78547 type:complete len:221 (+) Transcript_24920:1685-2347(+)